MEREITITVTDDEAERIEERVASGEFRSAADYVHSTVSTALWTASIPEDVLLQLIEEDEADPGSDVSIEEAFEQVHRHIDELAAKRNGTA